MASFADFTKRFPKAQFPLVLGELSYRNFEKLAELLPEADLGAYVAPLEPSLDEYTEVLPVARFKHADYTAVIYWKAGLLHNHYRLATFDKLGNAVDNRVLAGQYMDGAEVTASAATLTEDRVVYIVSGQTELTERLGSAVDSSAIRLAIDDSGVIRELGERNGETL